MTAVKGLKEISLDELMDVSGGDYTVSGPSTITPVTGGYQIDSVSTVYHDNGTYTVCSQNLTTMFGYTQNSVVSATYSQGGSRMYTTYQVWDSRGSYTSGQYTGGY